MLFPKTRRLGRFANYNNYTGELCGHELGIGAHRDTVESHQSSLVAVAFAPGRRFAVRRTLASRGWSRLGVRVHSAHTSISSMKYIRAITAMCDASVLSVTLLWSRSRMQRHAFAALSRRVHFSCVHFSCVHFSLFVRALFTFRACTFRACTFRACTFRACTFRALFVRALFVRGTFRAWHFSDSRAIDGLR